MPTQRLRGGGRTEEAGGCWAPFLAAKTMMLLAALACGKCKGVDLASLPRRLAALASWRHDSSESVGGGLVIFSTAPAVESPFAQASEKTRLTLQAERALGGAPKAAGGGGHAAGNTRAAQLEARRLTWAQPIVC